MDFENMGAKKVAVITDKNLVRSLKERLNTLPLVDRLINELRGNLLILTANPYLRFRLFKI